jgi:hypothetical protein
LTIAVTLLLGLLPALRASAVKPASALKGGDDPHSRRRLMHALIALQVAFCFLVLFVAGLFAATFERLSSKPIGFSAERVLTLDIVAAHRTPPAVWQQAADRLRELPGVERAAICGMPLLGGGAWNGLVSVNGAPPSPVLAMFLNVSPGWTEAMGISFLAGRDLLPNETSPGAAIVNETFARQFFGASILSENRSPKENRSTRSWDWFATRRTAIYASRLRRRRMSRSKKSTVPAPCGRKAARLSSFAAPVPTRWRWRRCCNGKSRERAPNSGSPTSARSRT